MSTQEITYRQLRAIVDDMQFQMDNSPSFRIFNGHKVARFFQQNSIRIQTLHKRTFEMIDKYVQKGDDGEPMTEDQEGKKVYKFETDDQKESYLKDLNEFMSISFKVNV